MNDSLKISELIAFTIAVAVGGGLLFLGSLMNGGVSPDVPGFGQSDYSTTITAPVTFEENVTLGDAAADIMRAVGTLRASSTLQATGVATFYAATTTFNGVNRYSQSQAFDTATTTVCSLQSPNATSTLLLNGGTGATWSVSSTTNALVTFARATTAFATTTVLGDPTSIGTGQATLIASSTAAQDVALAPYLFAPNTWLVIGMSGNIGTFSPTGNCWATWITGN